VISTLDVLLSLPSLSLFPLRHGQLHPVPPTLPLVSQRIAQPNSPCRLSPPNQTRGVDSFEVYILQAQGGQTTTPQPARLSPNLVNKAKPNGPKTCRVRVRRAILVTIHKRTPTPTQLANKHTYNACLSSPLRYHHSATAEHSPTPTNGQPVSPDLTSFHPIPRPISVHHLGVTLPPHPHLQPRASAAPPNSLPRSLLAGRRSTPSSPRHHLLVQVPRWVQTHVTRSTSRGTALQTAPYRTPLHRTASLRPTLPNPNHPDRCSTSARSWNPQAIPVIHWKHRRTLFGSNFVLSRPDQHRTVDHSTAPEP
jgi:hypothetical protein